jgi:translation initiation factor 2-alpha kinase 4
MELCKETLSDFLKERQKNYLLDDELFKTEVMVNYLKVFCAIAQSLQYVHKNELIHRDIKPANIFITNESNIKLGDFGLAVNNCDAKYVKYERKVNTNDSTNYHTKNVGTVLYASNEQLNDNYYNQKVKIFLIP